MINLLVNLSPRYRHIDFTPSEGMVAEAEQGLAWWRKHGGRGGHEMALARAWHIRRRSPLSPDLIRRMAAHMARLEERKSAGGWHEWDAGHPSDSRITWALMGGDAGFAWAQGIVRQLDDADTQLQPGKRPGQLAANALEQQRENGRAYRVAPVVALVPGVVNGMLVTAEELAASADAWNGRPVTLRHPKVGDQYVSANDPAVAASQRIGTLRNVAFLDGRLKGELWLDPDLCAGVGPEALAVLKAMEEGTQYEVSTGYFCQVLDHAGAYEDAPFDGEQVGIIPDHLAVLPDEVGACSWADGCGAPRVNVFEQVQEPAPVSQLVANAEGAPRTDAMVAFMLRDEAARYAGHVSEWPEGSRPAPPAEYHVTLVYLGEIADLPPYGDVAKAVSEFARFQPALHGQVSGVGRFSDGAMDAVYLSVDSAPLQTMQAELAAYLHASGIPSVANHGFTPHITLGYAPLGAAMELTAPQPSALAVDAIALAWGGDVTVFPLQGEAYSLRAEALATNECTCEEEAMAQATAQEMVQETVQDVTPQQTAQESAQETEGTQGMAEVQVQEERVEPGTAELVARVEVEPSEADNLVAAFGGVETVRAMLEQFQANMRAEQDEAVGRLIGNARCAFSEDELRAMPLEVLRKLDASLRPADYSLRPTANAKDDNAVTLYGQTWKPYSGPTVNGADK